MALFAQGGGILRASTSPVTSADLTLPRMGAVGSLGWSSDILVDSTAIFVVNVGLLLFPVPPNLPSVEQREWDRWATQEWRYC